MSSVGEIASAVQQATAESDDYLETQRPTARMLDKLSRTQQALSMVLGEVLSDVMCCADELDKHVAAQPAAAQKIGTASMRLSVVSDGTENKGLQLAANELERVSDDAGDFGSLLVTMSMTVANQRNMLTDIIEQLEDAAGATYAMAQQASDYVLRTSEANIALHMYAEEISQ